MSLVSSETVLAASTAVFIIICLAFYAVGRKNRTDQSPFALKFVKEDDGALHIEVSGFPIASRTEKHGLSENTEKAASYLMKA